jgi:hypothetical protein
MKKVVRLTESDLVNIIKTVIKEQRISDLPQNQKSATPKPNLGSTLSPQGCTQVDSHFEMYDNTFVFDELYIKKGTCFTKNTKPLSELKPKTKINFPSFDEETNFKGENWDRVKNSVPDTFFTIDSYNNMLFYCDKNESPIDDKSNIVFFSAKYSGSRGRYRWKLYGEKSKSLEIALQKHFCKNN